MYVCISTMCILLQPVGGTGVESKDAEVKLNLSESEVQQTVENAPPATESDTATATPETAASVN